MKKSSESLVDFFRWLWRRHPTRTTMIILFMSVQSISAGGAIFLLVPLLNTLGFVAETSASMEVDRMLFLFTLYVVLNIASSTFTALSTIEGVKIREEAVRYLRVELHRATMRIRWASVGELNVTELRRVVTEEAGRTALTIDLLVKLASTSLVLLSYFIVLVWINPVIGIAALAIGATLFSMFTRFRLRSKQEGRNEVDLRAQMNRVFIGQLATLKTIRLSGHSSQASEQFFTSVESLGKAHYQQRSAQAWLRAILEAIAAVLLILLTGLLFWANDGAIASTLVLLYLGARILVKATSLHEMWMQCLISLSSFHRVIEFIDWLQERSLPSKGTGALPMIGEWQLLTLQNISFSYAESTDTVLNNIDAQICRGQTTALFGQSGSGKTTLADIALGLLQPTNGKVLVDDVIENPVAEQWQNCRVCYVGQNSAMVPGSIRENLNLAGTSYSDSDILEALEIVNLKTIVTALPNGLSTEIGESETVFSGGELQRLVLARVWLEAPDFLVLDEATNQVDSATEANIMLAFERQIPDRTMLIISHRLATVRNVDKIYVLEKGRVMESGSFKDLMKIENGILRAYSHLQNT